MDTVATPSEKLLLVLSTWPPPATAGSRAITSARVTAPVRAMSSALITCTGEAVSLSTRLIEEPVISIRSSFCESAAALFWAWACRATIMAARAIRE